MRSGFYLPGLAILALTLCTPAFCQVLEIDLPTNVKSFPLTCQLNANARSIYPLFYPPETIKSNLVPGPNYISLTPGTWSLTLASATGNIGYYVNISTNAVTNNLLDVIVTNPPPALGSAGINITNNYAGVVSFQSNLNVSGRINATNMADANGDYLNFNPGDSSVTLYNSGLEEGNFDSFISLTAGGNVDVEPQSGGSVYLAGGNSPGTAGATFSQLNGAQIYQGSGNALSIYDSAAAQNSAVPETVNILAHDFTVPDYTDKFVIAGNSNNYDFIIGTEGTVQLTAIWWAYTNVSGQSTYAADLADRRIQCDPTSASCQVTLMAQGTPGQTTYGGNWFHWTYTMGYVSGGVQRGPARGTLDYVIENLASNTPNTLKVCLADHAPFANIGTTNLTIPNGMAAQFTSDGTNVFCHWLPMTSTPTYNGQFYPSNSLTVAAITNSITNDGCWIGRMSNQLMEVSMSNNAVTFTKLGP